MPKELPDGAWTTVTVRLREADVARIDAARGERSRSEWLRGAGLAVLGAVPLNAVAAVPSEMPPEVHRYTGTPQTGDDSGVPVHRKRAGTAAGCPHPKARVIKGLCGACGTHTG